MTKTFIDSIKNVLQCLRDEQEALQWHPMETVRHKATRVAHIQLLEALLGQSEKPDSQTGQTSQEA